ncbi:MAG TPA: alpha/beta fold hydrolase, partial [Streptosporangiaceae bacterium]|nr:alpha/beta fold hydrolase [Streptosporangiaceae bacterium]
MPMKLLPAARPAAFLAGALACAIAAAGCTSGGSAAPGGPASPPATSAATGQAGELHWHSCPIPPAEMRCASLQVPVDYRHPAGRKITLAVSEMPATAPAAQQQGYLLVNPGGPGASGLSLAADVAAGLDPTVASEYNIIGFDPRGVGSSVPALHCDPSFFAGVRPDYIPANAHAEQVLLARAKSYAAGCQRRYGWLLPFMTTADTARDMDSIRAALGQQKISYFGYSWGTYLGQVYATLFPQRLRRMALDSVVNPRGVWYQDNIDQDYAFEGRIRAFFSWIAAHDAVYHLGSTQAQVQQAWYRARARLEAHPIAGATGPMIGPDEFDDTFLVGGYTDTVWPGLATALAAYLRQHDNAPMVEAFQTLGAQNENENLFAVYNAVQCSDVNWPRNWAKWDADTRRVYRTAPFEAWDNAWFN